MDPKRLADRLLAFGALFLLPLHLFIVTGSPHPDLWGHLWAGRLMAETGAVPRADPLMLALREPWVSHQWLFQRLAYLLYQAGGFAALELTRLALWTGIVALAWASVASRSRALAPRLTALAPALLTLGLGLNLRPQLVTYLGCALIAALLQASLGAPPPWRERGRRWLERSPWLLWPWSFLHGAFLAGAGVLGVILAAGAVNRRRFGLFLALALAATAVNPYGFAMWTHLWSALTAADMPRYLEEWQPAWSADPVYKGFFLFWALALPAAYWAAPKRERDAASWLVALACLAASAKSVRHLPILAIFAAAPLAAGLEAATSRGKSSTPPRAFLWALSGTLAALFAGVLLADFAGPPRPDAFSHPAGAVSFLQSRELAGVVLNDFRAGSYLAWRLEGRARVWVDTRCPEHCDRKLFEAYLRWTSGAEGWKEVPRLLPTDLILASKRQAVFDKTAELKGWRPLYRDSEYVLLAPAGRFPELERECASGGCHQ